MNATLQRGMKMREVKVNRKELLEKVRANRETHVRDYEESVIGYKAAALKAIDEGMAKLRRSVEELKTGQVLHLAAVSFDLEVPENHKKDYDQVIAMLEMSVDDQLTIRSDEFALYVMDDWSWKANFDKTTTTYKSMR